MGKKKGGASSAQSANTASSPAITPPPRACDDAPIASSASPPVKRVPALEVPRITRMEEEERKILSEALYQSELDKIERRDDQSTVLRQTNAQKLQGFKTFATMLSDPVNKRVMRVFVFVTLLMFSIPIIALYIGMGVLAPLLGMQDDKETVGGLFAVASTLVIMVGYVVFALAEDAVFDERVQEAITAESRVGKKDDGGKSGNRNKKQR